jgi:hypothetical protein
VRLPHDPGPYWGEVGIHGLHRHRRWDAVATVDAPLVEGDEMTFVVLEGGAVVSEDGVGDPAALESSVALAPPFRAEAVRRDGGIWVVGATRIRTAVLADDPGGDRVEIAWDGTERSVRIDGTPTLAGVPDLERLGASRSPAYVVTAWRLVGSVWEVSVAPL